MTSYLMVTVFVAVVCAGLLSIISAESPHIENNGKNFNINTVNAQPAKASANFATTATWQQDFSKSPDGSIDKNKWNFNEGNNKGWGNNEAQTYTGNTENVGIRNGALVITATKTGSNYTSARISTKDKFDFMYGKMDIVAQLPIGQGVWPALWFWPTDSKYTKESVSGTEEGMKWLNNGEIDLVEGGAQGDDTFSGSAHALGHYTDHNERTGSVTVGSPASQFHTYSLEWTPQSLVFMVDGKAFQNVTNSGKGFRDWPYDQKYHLIINIALGGSMSKNLVSTSMPLGINDKTLPAQMRVQSINYYPYVGK